MRLQLLKKTFSMAVMMQFVFASAAALFLDACLDAHAEDSTHLVITQTEITDELIEAEGEIPVNVTISGNTDGFRATSFGIRYDAGLTLKDCQGVGSIGNAHTVIHNESEHLLWFQGASSEALTNNLEETIFTLYFAVPEDYTVGSEYPISFEWKAMDNSESFWYTDNHSNIIGNIKGCATSGKVYVSDPNAPYLSKESLFINPSESKTLTLENLPAVSGNIVWFSDDTSIASVSSGIVTGNAPGICHIYALLNGIPYICTVTVTEERNYDICDTDQVTLTDPDEKVILNYPQNQNVEWISIDTSIVTVQNGILTGKKNGTAKVFAVCGSTIQSVEVIVNYPGQKERGNGDLDNDDAISISDAIILCRCISGACSITPDQAWAADAYRDGVIDATDAVYILHAIVKVVDSLPYYPEQTNN